MDVGGNDLFDDGISQGFLAFEVVVQCALGDPAARMVSRLALWKPDL
jgi:hypothetical protein